MTREEIEAETAAALAPFEGKIITEEVKQEMLAACYALIEKHAPEPQYDFVCTSDKEANTLTINVQEIPI